MNPQKSTTPAWAGTLAERAGACLMAAYDRAPIEIASGEGCRVFDSGGRSYLDFAAGIAVSSLGHRHPAVMRALREGAEGLLHVSNLYWSEPMIRVAEKLQKLTGMERAFFCNSGAEAIETGLKLARRALPGRTRFVVFSRSFHGRTFGALSATAQARYQDPFRPLVPGFETIPYGDFDAASAAVDGATAAVLVEPIQGEGGVGTPPPGWLAHLRALCDRSGALLLADEVQSGCGRTGTFLACQGEGVMPDVVALAKGIAGGLPMGVALARGEAARAFIPGDHGSTFGGGPFVAGVAATVLEIVGESAFLAQVAARGKDLGDGLEDLCRRHRPLAASVRGRGLIRGLALDRPAARFLVGELRERGMIAVPAGADVLRLLPPLMVTREEIKEALGILDQALAALARRPPLAAAART